MTPPPRMNDRPRRARPPRIRSTTVLTVRRGDRVALGADGQVSMGDTVAKPDAVKVRKLPDVGAEKAGVLVGFAGSAADAFALLDKFEEALRARPEDLRQAAVDLAKLWRTDRMLRRLESLMAVVDRQTSLLVSGSGDVIEPGDGVIGVGSGGTYAVAAARALVRHTDHDAEAVCQESLQIASEICVYTNDRLTVLTL
ncbi:MAG: ATP-dependent protease subunit HslV [Planctomycetota bacterium]